MDKAMRIFSAVATLFMPLTLASGIWGMNVQVPWSDVEGLGPFFGIIGFMILVIIIMLICFKKRSWL